jgi:RNA polymerase sigma-70 factor, ECF subfamily
MPIYERHISETEIVACLQRGENSGYELICDRYEAMLFGIISRIVEDHADAENLLQDCFVKVWRNINTYDSSKGRLATWLINIARNTAIDFTRSKFYSQKRKNQNIEYLVSSTFDVSDAPIMLETIGLRQVVEGLPPQYKQVIEWMYFDGYTQQEIADKFSIPLGTVKTRTRMALQELRRYYDLV